MATMYCANTNWNKKLDENDIPGAKLMFEQVEKNTVCQLKRWLKCRSQCVKGKKAQLVDRVKWCIERGVELDQYVDGGHWLSIKNTSQNSSSKAINKIPDFPKDKWTPFPSNEIPKTFNDGHIYKYLIDFCSPENKNEDDNTDENDNHEDFSTEKSLKRAEQYFNSGHVTKMQDSVINEYYCVQSSVLASFQSNVQYKVNVMLSKNGEVMKGKCCCKASALGRCSHVAAVLYAIRDYMKCCEKEKIAPTSKLCYWNQGRKKKEPTQAAEKQYNYKASVLAKQSFDPRISRNVCDPDQSNDKVSDFFTSLEIYSFKKYQGAKYTPCGWELLLQPAYEDYKLTAERKNILREQVTQFRFALESDVNGPKEITEDQDTQKWKNLRKLLITASNVKSYVLPKNANELFNLVKRHLWEDVSMDFVPALRYGKENENNALQDYIAIFGYEVKKTGLWINSNFPGLGASPDALVYDAHEEFPFGLLEIKCPKVLQFLKPTDVLQLNPKQKASFCCQLINSDLILKKNHTYYYQIQLQMAITERLWCDFLIWTPKGIHVERIRFDCDMVEYISTKAVAFHENILCPEYFEMRIPRNLMPFDLKTVQDDV